MEGGGTSACICALPLQPGEACPAHTERAGAVSPGGQWALTCDPGAAEHEGFDPLDFQSRPVQPGGPCCQEVTILMGTELKCLERRAQ